MSEVLKGKVAIVTGAASGMGRATAEAMLAAGASVVAADVSEAGLLSLAPHPQLRTVQCDVTNKRDVAAVVATAVAVFGGLDIACTAAGICQPESIVGAGIVWARTMAINVDGTLNVCSAAIPEIKARGGGAIVTWASTNAFQATPNLAAYNVSKAAVLMLTKSIAVDHAEDGIRANAICPGWVRTPMAGDLGAAYGSPEAWHEAILKTQPLGMASPEAIAETAVFLASDASALTTGSAVMVDGGLTAKSASVSPPPLPIA
ncbi:MULTISPECIES: SDR family oxidoreductase [Microbacterium]|uniref:SDR family NAD(P)-dependent oxidoreductase n=1 Tax=Microbacterium TaxID=33882 RepID=UPI000D653082|nr:SDR family oxidoreductase [Microbacterium sp. KCTC 39802]